MNNDGKWERSIGNPIIKHANIVSLEKINDILYSKPGRPDKQIILAPAFCLTPKNIKLNSENLGKPEYGIIEDKEFADKNNTKEHDSRAVNYATQIKHYYKDSQEIPFGIVSPNGITIIETKPGVISKRLEVELGKFLEKWSFSERYNMGKQYFQIARVDKDSKYAFTGDFGDFLQSQNPLDNLHFPSNIEVMINYVETHDFTQEIK